MPLLLGLLSAVACHCPNDPAPESAAPGAPSIAPAAGEDTWAYARRRMVDEQIAARDVTDPRVLEAMRRVPRHLFVPEDAQSEAYADHPLSIGHDQTISQPYIVALMSQLAEIARGDRVLEIGTGSGYQAAVLAELGAEVYTIEIVEPLAREAEARLRRLGYDRVHVRAGDGYGGWPEHAPFDAVIVTAAPPRIPDPLREQLAVGAHLVAPEGGGMVQQLVVLTRTAEGYDRRDVIPVLFVPMTGEVQRKGR